MNYRNYLDMIEESSPPGFEKEAEKIKDNGTEARIAFATAWKQFKKLVHDNKEEFSGLVTFEGDHVHLVDGKRKEIEEVVKKIKAEKEKE